MDFSGHREQSQVIMEADDTEAIKRLVEARASGYSVLPEFALRNQPRFSPPVPGRPSLAPGSSATAPPQTTCGR